MRARSSRLVSCGAVRVRADLEAGAVRDGRPVAGREVVEDDDVVAGLEQARRPRPSRRSRRRRSRGCARGPPSGHRFATEQPVGRGFARAASGERVRGRPRGRREARATQARGGAMAPRPAALAASRRDPPSPRSVAVTRFWAAGFSGSIAERAHRLEVRRPLVAPLERDTGQPDDRDRVLRVALRDLAIQALGLVDQAEGQSPARPRAAARSRVGPREVAGQEEQRRRLVELRILDDPLEAARRGSGRATGRAPARARAIRSSPSIASADRSRIGPARSSASTRARSSASPSASRSTPLPALSASRSSNSSSIASGPTLPMKPAHRRVGPGRLVAEHVVADEVGHPVDHDARLVEPFEQRPGQLGADRLVAVEMAVGRGRRACRCRGRAPPGARPGGRAPRRPCPSVWSQRSSPANLVLGHARAAPRAPAGRRRAARCRRSSRSPTDGRSAARSLAQLGRDPLAGEMRRERRAMRGSPARCRARSRTRASRRAGRRGASAARLPRSASLRLADGRRIRAGDVAGPSNGSLQRRRRRRGLARPQAIAFTVKSRRARSASSDVPNSTRCGRRKSA